MADSLIFSTFSRIRYKAENWIFILKKPNEIPNFLLKMLDKFHAKKPSRILGLRYLYMGPLIKL
jgi:hypothetical protein